MTERLYEDRKFKRIPFSASKKIEAVCTSIDNNLMNMHIANLSEGGVGLIAKKEMIKGIKVNDVLILNQIVGTCDLEFIKNIKIEVRWLLGANSMENVGIGCRFMHVSNTLKEKIIFFMNTMEVVAD